MLYEVITVYGGIVMGQGYGICEDMEPVKGKCVCTNLDSYIIPTAMDIPEMQINLFECDDPSGTYGAKSVGEPATEAVAAAIANAIANATGKRIRTNRITSYNVCYTKLLRARATSMCCTSPPPTMSAPRSTPRLSAGRFTAASSWDRVT